MSVPLPVVTSAVSAALFESGSTNRAYTLSRTGDTRSPGFDSYQPHAVRISN